MTTLARGLLIACAALALVAAAGCGGSDTKSSNNYVDAINKAQTDFASSVQKVSAPAAGSDPAKAAQQTFANLKTAIDKMVSDLKAVTPPDKVKDLHNELVSELQQFDNEVKTAGDSLSSNSPQSILKAQTKFASDASTLGTRISTTIDNINKKLQG